MHSAMNFFKKERRKSHAVVHHHENYRKLEINRKSFNGSEGIKEVSTKD